MATKKTVSVDVAAEVVVASKTLAPAVKRLKKVLDTLDPAKLPVGAAADLLYDLRQTAKMLSALSAPFDDAIGPAAKLLEEHFVQTLKVGEASGVQGMHSRIQVTEAAVPNVADWPKFYAHIKKTGAFELLGRAVNKAAVKERWDLKKDVPGVVVFRQKKVSCTKLGGK